MNNTSAFEVSSMLVAQGVNLLLLMTLMALPIFGTLKIFKTYNGVQVPLWCLFNWMVPIIGPIITLLYISKKDKTISEQLEIF